MGHLHGEQYRNNATKETRFANKIPKIRDNLQKTCINNYTT